MKMKSPMELGKVGEFIKNTAQGKGVAGAIMNPIGAIANKFTGGGDEAQEATQQAQQQMQQPAPTMMKKKSPSKKLRKPLKAQRSSAKQSAAETKASMRQRKFSAGEGFKKQTLGAKVAEGASKMKAKDAAAKMKKESPSKLRKPTRKMDTAEEAPRMTKRGSATRKTTGLKPMTKEQRAKAAKGDKKMTAEIKKALGKRGETAPTKHIKGQSQFHMMQHKFDGDHQDFRRGKTAPTKMKKESMAKMKKAPSKFNAKLKAASAAGKLSGKFKEAVDASPAKMKKATKAERAEMAKGDKKMTPKIREAMKSRAKNIGKK
tara:strand:- start:765 stop:1718 length:954 start_codon:yes stop_codon:yes gene_type:complete